MTKAFCFGNGNSRKGLNLDYFKKHGTVIGCNAVYRDFTPVGRVIIVFEANGFGFSV